MGSVQPLTPDALQDPLALAQALIQRPSITPVDAGALDVLQGCLESLGFTVHRLPYGEGTHRVDNLYARRALPEGAGIAAKRCFGYAGHTDVVPVQGQDWDGDPFSASIQDGMLIGRGASDMKGGIACFVAAVARFLNALPTTGTEGEGVDGAAIAFLITGDEEGPAVHGTRKVLEWMRDHGEHMDHCLVGEPTNPAAMGEMIKIGRRGSINMVLTMRGTPGHVAYPHLTDNPIHRLVRLLDRLAGTVLDDGTEHFQPSSLQVTSVDVGNEATNVVPATAQARLNIRFNDLHSGASLTQMVRSAALEVCDNNPDSFVLEAVCSGEAFLTPPGVLSDLLTRASQSVTGQVPELSTSGGTSDARFICNHCPTAEFGLVNKTMHKANEQVAVDDMMILTDIYHRVLSDYFQQQDTP